MKITGRQLLSATVSLSLSAVSCFAVADTRAAAAAPACSGNAVIVSMPLINSNTGQSSWNNGYVQLWYNGCSGNNWARVVSQLSGTTLIDADVYNTDHVSSGWAHGYPNPNPLTSGQIHSPVKNAGAFGDVIANGVAYYAESDQAGANCSTDVFNGTQGCAIG